MDEQRHAMLRKDDIGRSRQVASVQPESIAEGVRDAAHDQLGVGVALADATHQRRTALSTDDVHGSGSSAIVLEAAIPSEMTIGPASPHDHHRRSGRAVHPTLPSPLEQGYRV
jgi:hypothetical protein